VPGDPFLGRLLDGRRVDRAGIRHDDRNVGLNPTRAGLFEILRSMMGADITEVDPRIVGGEPVADLRVRHAQLQRDRGAARTRAQHDRRISRPVRRRRLRQGRTVARGAHELRVKESDRIATMAAALARLGARSRNSRTGADHRHRRRAAARRREIASKLDHRIAMSMTVAGLASANAPMTIDDVAPGRDELPDFVDLMIGLGAE
jgi:3-phosphoshikimate 1-carboxyvinyltransferase